jgi:hypothetical protein
MSSCIPAARIYFLNMCRNVLPQDTFIWYGAKLSLFSSPLMLQCYGWHAIQEPAELAPNLRREEIFDLDCCLSSFQGDQDFDAREAEVMTNWSLITTALGNDASFNGGGTGPGIVRWAQITEYEFQPMPDPEGKSIGSLEFKVGCVQRIESMS